MHVIIAISRFQSNFRKSSFKELLLLTGLMTVYNGKRCWEQLLWEMKPYRNPCKVTCWADTQPYLPRAPVQAHVFNKVYLTVLGSCCPVQQGTAPLVLFLGQQELGYESFLKEEGLWDFFFFFFGCWWEENLCSAHSGGSESQEWVKLRFSVDRSLW